MSKARSKFPKNAVGQPSQTKAIEPQQPASAYVATVNGWALAVKRYMAELYANEYSNRLKVKVGDVCIEITTMIVRDKHIDYNKLTVGKIVDISEHAEDGTIYEIERFDGTREKWGNAMFFRLSEELLFIYEKFILR